MFITILFILCIISSNTHSFPKTTTTPPGDIKEISNENKLSNFVVFIIVVICIILAVMVFIAIGNCFSEYQEAKELKNTSRYQSTEDNYKKPSQKPTKSISKPTGLKNTNETCYMNSMIQALASSQTLIKVYEEILKNCDNKQKDCKLAMLINLLKDINSSRFVKKSTQENTNSLKELIGQVKWTFESQQDSFQLLTSVINAIERDIKEILEKENITMPPKFTILHSFTESSNFNKVQNHLALAIPLCGEFRCKPGVRIRDLMNSFFLPSKIEDSKNETQMLFFLRTPQVLILHIQANEWDDLRGEYVKPKYHIIYGETLKYTFNIQMKKDGSEIKKEKVEYGLRAVVHHMGSVTGGHYVTYRVHNGRWYLTNDVQVEEVSFNCDIIPYIMVYEKKEEIL